MPESTQAPPNLMSIRESADLLNVSVDTIRGRIKDGTLNAYRIGPRVLRVKRSDVENLLKPAGGAR